jgi:MFS family permease
VPKAVAAANSDGTSVRRIAAAHSAALRGVGTGVLVLAAARATRPVVVPLAAHSVNIAPGLASILVGAIAAVELLLVYPAGIAMDRLGRRWVATPCLIVMGIGLIVLSVAAGPVAVVLGAVVLAAGSGLGSGIVKTLGADLAPDVGRGTFLGVWGVLTEAGGAAGPVGVSGFTALMSFGWGVGIIGAACLGAAVWLDRAVKRHIPARTREPVRPAS